MRISFLSRLSELADGNSESPKTMVAFDPLMPIPLLVLYTALSFATLTLCSLSFVAICKTKRTPYATKLLAMSLLTYDFLFLVLSCVSKFFDYNDVYVVYHMSRGFQIAAQTVVGAMAIERLFVLNWPYVYLRVATDSAIRWSCFVLCLFSFIQYYGMRTALCYVRDKALNCGTFSIYFMLVSTLIPSTSFISYIKIYKIIKKSSSILPIRQYKGTVACFLVLINATVTQVVCLTLSVVYFTRNSSGIKDSGLVATLADSGNLLNCIMDPLIYVIWFKETRIELLKLIQRVFPCVKQSLETMQNETLWISEGKVKSESCSLDV